MLYLYLFGIVRKQIGHSSLWWVLEEHPITRLHVVYGLVLFAAAMWHPETDGISDETPDVAPDNIIIDSG